MVLLIFFLVYFFLVFVLRSWLLWKRTGINPLNFGDADDAHGFNGKIFKLISGVELIVLVIYAFGGKAYEYLLPFWYLEITTLCWTGWALLIASLIWIIIAQSQMASAWRIGVDEVNKTELVTKGLFSISRNPIFLGIIIANAGLFLVLPNAFTLLIGVLSTVSVHTQVRLEESFLEGSHGNEYKAYKSRVRRWI